MESIAHIELEQLKNCQSEEKSLIDIDMSIFGHVCVEVSAQIGHANLSIESIFALKPGEVVKLEQRVDETITLLIDNKPIARGHLVAIDDNFGVQILEVIS